jgi:tetratricopeptide (TPR) repeat protein
MTKQPQAQFHILVAHAAAQFKAGRFAEAETAYRAALAMAPGHTALTHNLGAVVAAQGDQASALELFDAAIAAEPGFVSAHYNRAMALQALGRASEAIKGLSRVCALEPQHYDAHRALGFLWLAQGDRGRALDHFARTYDLRRGDDRIGIALKSLTGTTRDKLRHDAEQFRHLSTRRRDRQRFEILARNYQAVSDAVSEGVVTLSEEQFDLLGDDYNTAIHVRSAPERPERAVAERPDRDELTRQFQAGAGAVAFDDLLTPAALLGLQQYLLESTIWHDFSHIDGFVASYLEDGLACPLVLQIADEIRAAFPDVLGAHPLCQAWAFKGLRTTAAVDAHADDAAVSVNFWVTPTQANLNPDRGGLVICCAPPPAGWAMKDYDSDQDRIVTFLEQNASSNLIIPYRENRAALFRSRLFHHSDKPEFATRYENHRVNLTLLYR